MCSSQGGRSKEIVTACRVMTFSRPMLNMEKNPECGHLWNCVTHEPVLHQSCYPHFVLERREKTTAFCFQKIPHSHISAFTSWHFKKKDTLTTRSFLHSRQSCVTKRVIIAPLIKHSLRDGDPGLQTYIGISPDPKLATKCWCTYTQVLGRCTPDASDARLIHIQTEVVIAP